MSLTHAHAQSLPPTLSRCLLACCHLAFSVFMQSAQIHLCTEYVYRLFHLQAMQMIWYEHESDFREFRCDLRLNACERLARLPFVPFSVFSHNVYVWEQRHSFAKHLSQTVYSSSQYGVCLFVSVYFVAAALCRIVCLNICSAKSHLIPIYGTSQFIRMRYINTLALLFSSLISRKCVHSFVYICVYGCLEWRRVECIYIHCAVQMFKADFRSKPKCVVGRI